MGRHPEIKKFKEVDITTEGKEEINVATVSGLAAHNGGEQTPSHNNLTGFEFGLISFIVKRNLCGIDARDLSRVGVRHVRTLAMRKSIPAGITVRNTAKPGEVLSQIQSARNQVGLAVGAVGRQPLPRKPAATIRIPQPIHGLNSSGAVSEARAVHGNGQMLLKKGEVRVRGEYGNFISRGHCADKKVGI